MTRDEIELIPDTVASGKKSWEQVTKELVVFIVTNKPMFGLQKFDEDFISDFIIQFLLRATDSLAEYENTKGGFLSYLFCIIRNIVSGLNKKAAINSRIEYHNISESIANYENVIEAYKNIRYDEFERPKVPYSYKPISYKAFQIACKTDSYHIKRIITSEENDIDAEFKAKLKGYSPKMIQNILMVLALKSSYYITDEQIEKISHLLNINKTAIQQIIQELKSLMDSRINNKEKIEIRRNRADYNHKTIRDQIKWNELNLNTPQYENLKLNLKYEKNTKSWKNINHQLEQGKILIRPTTKLIAKVLGMSSRQVTYYQSTARKLGLNICKV